MKTFTIAAIFALLCVPAASARAGDLRLTIANGRVTIIAQDVPLRQILDEWGRVGGTKVVGAERLTGPAISLELHDVPEGRALETLLRSASGYIAKPRSGTVGASAYDRILIMAASTPPAGGRSAAPPAFNNRPQPQVVMPNVVVDDDEPTPNGIMPPGSRSAAVPAVPGATAAADDTAGHAAGATGRTAGDADDDASRNDAAAGAEPEHAGESVSDESAAAAHRQAARAGRARRTVTPPWTNTIAERARGFLGLFLLG